MMNKHAALNWMAMGLWGALLTAAAATPAWAQEKKDWDLLFAVGQETPRPMQALPLRPNVAQAVTVYLKNNHAKNKQDITVRFVQLKPGGKTKILAEALLEKVGAKDPVLIKFKPATPAKGEIPPKGDGPELKLEGPPFRFQIQVLGAKKDEPLWTRDLEVNLQQPHEYVIAAQPRFDKKASRLAVELEFTAKAADATAEVKLVLDRDTMPELLPATAGLLEEKMNANAPKIELHASDLKFVDNVPPKNGRVYLTIDGFERAYLFKSTFDQGVLSTLSDQTRVRIKVPRFFNPNPKTEAKEGPKVGPKMPVKLEIDGVLDPDAKVEVSFKRAEDLQFVRKKTYPGLRAQSLAFALGEEGALQLTTTVKDWLVEEDTTGMFGKCLLRVRVLNAKGKPLPLADESDLVLFSRDAAVNALAPLSYDEDRTAVFADIVVDSTGLDGVKLVDLPEDAVPGKMVYLKAVVKERTVHQVPIAKVQFFVGEMDKDPVILPGRFDMLNQVWHAKWLVPGNAKKDEKWPITVQFTTATGLLAANSGQLRLKAEDEPTPVVGGDKEVLTKITGTVIWGSIAQPGLAVQLKDAKGAEVKSAKTNAEGYFVMDKVSAGSYTLSAAKTGFQGSKNITVPKGQKLLDEQDITLKRK